MTVRRGVRVFEIVVGTERLVVASVSTSTSTAVAEVQLTPSERAIAEAVAAGLSNAAIARRRGSSVRTVANQLAALYRKLGISSRAELVAMLHG